jgi:hypothetical protein
MQKQTVLAVVPKFAYTNAHIAMLENPFLVSSHFYVLAYKLKY